MTTDIIGPLTTDVKGSVSDSWKLAPDIGDRIKRFRDAAGWTQERLATEVNRAAQAISTWETGRAAPPKRVLAGLATRYGFPRKIFEESGPMPDQVIREPLGRIPSDLARPALKAQANSEESTFAIGVRAMIETMRRQIEALDHIVGPDSRGANVHEMLESMMRQVGALEILLLGATTRAAGITFDELVADMKQAAELGDRAADADEDRRSGVDRRVVG